MSHLAVIQTQSNPYHLVKEINGKYFEIEKIKTLSEALSLHMADFRKAYDAAGSTEVKGKLVAPVAIDTEVWGAGVTYQRSRDARKEESGIPDVYQLVYEADRPELFFKATARRTVGHEAEVGIRADAQTSVPEPEVAIVMNKFGELIGMNCGLRGRALARATWGVLTLMKRRFSAMRMAGVGTAPAISSDSGRRVISSTSDARISRSSCADCGSNSERSRRRSRSSPVSTTAFSW